MRNEGVYRFVGQRLLFTNQLPCDSPLDTTMRNECVYRFVGQRLLFTNQLPCDSPRSLSLIILPEVYLDTSTSYLERNLWTTTIAME